MSVVNSNNYMSLALECARKAFDLGEVPVGAVITYKKKILSQAHNLVEANKDVTSHAEILAIRHACQKLGTKYLDDCAIYVTLEPCIMCTHVILASKIKYVYFGAYDDKNGGIESCSNNFLLQQKIGDNHIQIYGGFMENECTHLISEFFCKVRSKK